MDFRKLCRICLLDNATVDITDHKASVFTTDDETETEAKDYTILELILEMFEKNICLDLVSEAPMICVECLENCLQNYRFFMKLKIANMQLRELYESREDLQLDLDLTVSKEEERQDDIVAMDENELIVVKMTTDEDIANSVDEITSQEDPETPSNQDCLIISDFLLVSQVPTDSVHPYPAVYTLDYAAIELKRDNLQEYTEASRQQELGTSVYKCKYCPMAYSSLEFLKSHMRKSHVCQYCTSAFVKVNDLNEHIRSNHTNHPCVICKKVFVSSTNLRAHIKHLHGIQLPAQVALLDYLPANSSESLE